MSNHILENNFKSLIEYGSFLDFFHSFILLVNNYTEQIEFSK